MTLSEVLAVLWRRKWLMAAIVIVTLVVAGALIQRHEVTYESNAVVRANATVAEAAGVNVLAGIPVSLDAFVLLSDGVLRTTAEEAAPALADLPVHEVEIRPDEFYGNERLYITARATDPDTARLLASEYSKAYVAVVDSEVSRATQLLTERRDQALSEAEELQDEVLDDPEDAILASSLSDALQRYQDGRDAVRFLESAGSSASVQISAVDGEATGANALTMYAVALFSALVAAVGVALLRDQFDYRLRGETDVEQVTGRPVLGELVYDRGVKRSRELLPVTNPHATALAESLRSTRAALQVLLPRERAVLVVTSVEPGDGKSFTTANIALAWARAGKNVIVVGGDLRRPSLETYFGSAATGPGFAEILQAGQRTGAAPSSASIESHLNNTEYQGLRVLPAGAPPADPGDLLANSAVGEVVESLRALADVVIFDTPPSLRLVDAGLIGEHADGVVVIAWEGRTDRRRMVEAVDGLVLNEINVIGMVVNGSKRRHVRSYAPYYVASSAKAARTPAVRDRLLGRSPASANDSSEREAEPEPSDTKFR